MLTTIENICQTEMDRVQFRLPSLFYKNSLKEQNLKSENVQFHNCQTNPDIEKKERNFEDISKKANRIFLSSLTNYSDEESLELPFVHPSKESLCMKRGLKNEKSINSSSRNEKMIWISDLRRWIKENTSSVEFIKLSQTSTIHALENWKELNCKHERAKELKKLNESNKLLESTNNASSKKTIISYPKNLKPKIKTPGSLKVLDDIRREPLKLNELNENLANQDTTSHVKNNVLISIDISPKSQSNDDVDETDPDLYPINPSPEINEDKDDINEHESSERIYNLVDNDETLIESSTNEVMVSYEEERNMESEMLNFDNETEISEKIPFEETLSEIIFETSLQTSDSENSTFRKSSISSHRYRDASCKVFLNDHGFSKTETELFSEDMETPNASESFKLFNTELSSNEIKPVMEMQPVPVLPMSDPERKTSVNKPDFLVGKETENLEPLLEKEKRRWGNKTKDLSYLADLEKEMAAEERRSRVEQMSKKTREKKQEVTSPSIPDGPRFESYGFLSKYCILQKLNVSLYRSTFEVCDEGKKQWLNDTELLMGLKAVNPNLKEYDIAYLNMVMKTCDYNLRYGADFKLFALLAALSSQIITLDSWIRNSIGRTDFKTLEKKTYICRQLWEVNVDPISKTISLDGLCVELKAGGVKENHIEEIRQRLGWMCELDILDYFTYVPLFIIIHSSIIDNPLDMSEKL